MAEIVGTSDVSPLCSILCFTLSQQASLTFLQQFPIFFLKKFLHNFFIPKIDILFNFPQFPIFKTFFTERPIDAQITNYLIFQD